jgi:hypothetical protein
LKAIAKAGRSIRPKAGAAVSRLFRSECVRSRKRFSAEKRFLNTRLVDPQTLLIYLLEVFRILFGRGGLVSGHVISSEDCVRRAFCDARAAVHALSRIDVKLGCCCIRGFSFSRVNSICRTGIDAKRVLRAGISDDVGHKKISLQLRDGESEIL